MFYTVKINDEIAVTFEAKPEHKTIGLVLLAASQEWAKQKARGETIVAYSGTSEQE